MATDAKAVVNQSMFDNFLKNNMEKINAIVPKNPTISKDDEWRNSEYDVYDEERNKR